MVAACEICGTVSRFCFNYQPCVDCYTRYEQSGLSYEDWAAQELAAHQMADVPPAPSRVEADEAVFQAAETVKQLIRYTQPGLERAEVWRIADRIERLRIHVLKRYAAAAEEEHV